MQSGGDKLDLILFRLEQQDSVLAEIKTQSKITNGRVTALERGQNIARGALLMLSMLLFSAAIPFLIAVFT